MSASRTNNWTHFAFKKKDFNWVTSSNSFKGTPSLLYLYKYRVSKMTLLIYVSVFLFSWFCNLILYSFKKIKILWIIYCQWFSVRELIFSNTIKNIHFLNNYCKHLLYSVLPNPVWDNMVRISVWKVKLDMSWLVSALKLRCKKLPSRNAHCTKLLCKIHWNNLVAGY